MLFPLERQSAGVMEWWTTVKYQISSTKSLGVRYQARKTKILKPEH
jgi:hypothetical protein